MRRRFFFPPLWWPLLLILGVLLVLIFVFFSGAVLVAFGRLGLPPEVAFTLFVMALLGSFVNIPIAEEVSYEPVLRVREVGIFGFLYPMPYFYWEERKTIISVNVGGALVPLSIVLYEVSRLVVMGDYGLLANIGAAVLLASLLSHAVARPVPGLGVVMPTLFPPLIAVLLALVFGDGNPTLVAYTSGTLGVLIGADLMKWNKIKKLGAPVVSIGGAGTFDGIFLAGIIAVLLV